MVAIFYIDLLYDWGLPYEYEDTLKTVEGVEQSTHCDPCE